MNTGMWSGINMICPDLATSTKSFSFVYFSLSFYFYFNLAHLFYGGGQVAWNPLRLFANPISHSTFHSTNLKWTPVPVFVTFSWNVELVENSYNWYKGKQAQQIQAFTQRKKHHPKKISKKKEKAPTEGNIKRKSNIQRKYRRKKHHQIKYQRKKHNQEQNHANITSK